MRRRPSRTRSAAVRRRRALIVLLASVPTIAPAVVITEIGYNPPGDPAALEFVEVASDGATPEDISGYRFTEGIYFEFPPGTILSKDEVIVVCADVAVLKSRYGIDNAIGDFVGRLDNDGERIVLANHAGIAVQSVRFRDGGKWPTEADGTGHTLVLRSTRLDSGEPESWTWSPELGGSPGRANFEPDDEEPTYEEVVLIDAGEEWRFARGATPFSTPASAWVESGFDDSSWETGPSGFGFGDLDDATVLDDMLNGYTSVACRKSFSVPAERTDGAEITLGMLYDDGFCAFLNGVPVASANCPVEPTHDAVATGSHEAGGVEVGFPVPASLLVAGTNVLAVVGYNLDVTSLDFSLRPRLVARLPVSGAGDERESTIVLNELFRSHEAGGSWVELYNRGAAVVDLSGFTLSDDPERPGPYVVPQGTTIPAGGFLAIDEAASGLGFGAPRLRLFLFRKSGLVEAAAIFERPAPADLVGGHSEARYPDGGPLDWVTETPTKGAPNRVPAVEDIVIDEIFYHPPLGRRGEFIELTNRGTSSVDLSGFAFDKGVTYTIEDGVVLPAGGYLVVAQDPALLLTTHGLAGALGPWTGVLADQGENVRLVDSWGNPVDEVRYADGGLWPEWADGDGASMELIDPRQENDAGAAWGDSDESEKAPWERLSYTVDDYRTAAESELHLMLVERGICLVDDISIQRSGGQNHVPNPGFETSTSPWIIEGTHIDSRRVTYDARSGAACLELNATGKGDTSVNRIEIETSPRLSDGPYEVSLWARWLRGASVIVARGEFSAGPWGGRPGPSTNLSGNTLGGRLRLTVPSDLGTPGRENSLRRLLREETGGTNLGPIVHEAHHEPPSPAANAPVTIRARASDSDGVAAVRVWYRLRSAAGEFAAVPMVPGADPPAGARLWTGQIPGQAAAAKVVFWIEATDEAGAIRRFPATAPARTLHFQVQGPATQPLETVKLSLDDASLQELSTRRLHSNDLVEGTLIFDDAETYYSVGVRYRGSPWGRPERSSFRVKLPKDRTLHPDLRAINLSARANGPVEAACYFLIGRCGTPEKPVSTPLYHFVASYFNGAYRGTQRLIEPVGREFLDKWFPGSEGPALKATARLAFDDSGVHVGYDGASFDYMGEDPENYRFYHNQVADRSLDDWDGFLELTRVLDPRATSDAAHDAAIAGVLDVEGFLRVMVPRMFVSDWDTIGMGQGHNAYFILDSRDGRWETSPLDLNQAMPGDQLNFPLFPTFDRGYARLIARPSTKRVYARIVDEYLSGYWSLAKAGPFLDAMEREAGIPMAEVRSFISSRATILANQIRAFTQVTFRILTNGGADIVTEEPAVELEGESSVRAAAFLYLRNGVGPQPLEPTWTTPTRWRATFELRASATELEILGLDVGGSIIGEARIRIATSAEIGFLRGDSNSDGRIDISDPVAALLHLFSGRALDCGDAADFDDDGSLNLTDAIGALDYLFREGPAPRAPYPELGSDPTPDSLECGL